MRYNYNIEYNTKVFEKGINQVYLFKFYDDDGNLIFSKVGTTTRTIEIRIKEEIRQYTKDGFIIGHAAVESVFDCGDMPPEYYENYIKSRYIAKSRESYQVNDRFIKYDISVKEFNKIFRYAKTFAKKWADK